MKLMLVHSHRSDQVRSDQLTTLFGSCLSFRLFLAKKFSSFFSKLEREKKKKKKRERERARERERKEIKETCAAGTATRLCFSLYYI